MRFLRELLNEDNFGLQRDIQGEVWATLAWAHKTCEQIHLSHSTFKRVQVRTVCPHITHDVTRSRVAQVQVALHKIVIPSLAQCLTPCMEHAALIPHPCPFFQVYKSCSHPEIPALIHETTGMTDTLIPNLSQVMSPTGSSTTRSLMNVRILPALKTGRLPKSRVMSNLCPATSHCCLPLKIPLKAVLCLKKQTWTKNKFVLCRLHHGIYRSEKQVRNDRKFITLQEKA